MLESVKAAIGPLADFTDMLSGEECVTLSALNAVLHILRADVLAVSSNDTILTCDLKSRILAYLEEKYSNSDTRKLPNVCSFLDPRFVSEYIDNSDVDIIKERLANEGLEFLVPILGQLPNTADTEDIPEEAEPSAKRMKLGSWLKKVKQASSTASQASQPHRPRERLVREIERYEAVMRPDSDSIKWWRNNELIFSLMAKLAKNYLCIAASSAASERVFSTAGHICSVQKMKFTET